MAEVALSEPSQPLASSIVARNGTEGGGTGAVPHHQLGTSRKPTTRARKIRTQDISRGTGGGGERRSSRGNVKMSSGKPPPLQKDFLSEQRSKRLERRKSKERSNSDRLRKNRDNVLKQKEAQSGEEEEEEEGREKIENIGVPVEEKEEAEINEQRTGSAGSDTSKDEGISSNGEKDEECDETKGTTQQLPADEHDDDSEQQQQQGEEGQEEEDDDEGRGSIQDDSEKDSQLEENLAPSPPPPEAEQSELGKLNPKGIMETLDKDAETDTPKGPRPEEYSPAVVDAQNDEDVDGVGYQGDMDEPNSLATSYQGSLGLSSDGGMDTTTDLSLLKDSVKEEASDEVEKEEENTNLENKDRVEKMEEKERLEVIESKGETRVEESNVDNVADLVQETMQQNSDDLEAEKLDDETFPKEEGLTDEKREEGDPDGGDGEKEENDQADEMLDLDIQKESRDPEEETAETDKIQKGSEAIETDRLQEESETVETKEEMKEDGTAEREKEKEDSSEDQSEKQITEEEIQELPAIAKLPGKHRSHRQHVKKTPLKNDSSIIRKPQPASLHTSNPYDTSKTMANRKPISWRPAPIQSSGQPENAKDKSTKPPQRTFRARKFGERPITSQNSSRQQDVPTGRYENKDEKKDTGEEEGKEVSKEKEGDKDNTEADVSADNLSTDALDLPPVNVSSENELSVPLALDTFRSEGHLPRGTQDGEDEEGEEGDSSQVISKAESMPDIPMERPRCPGKNRRRIGNKKFQHVKARINSTWGKNPPTGWMTNRSLVSQTGKPTSEVWVPEEDKLYVYTYSSQPRLLHVRRMGNGRGVTTTHQYDHDPYTLAARGNGNPMYDRRVVRGSNYSKRLGNEDHPKWNPYFSNARCLEQQSDASDQPLQNANNNNSINDNPHHHARRQEVRERLEARARLRRVNHGLSSLYSSHHGASHHAHHRPVPRSHTHVQTDNYYEPLERPPASEAGVQTDLEWGGGEGGLPPPTLYQPPRGVEASTQVFDNELSAGEGGEGVVAVLVATTVREALMEVMMEEREEEQRLERRRQEMLNATTMDTEPAPGVASGTPSANVVDSNEDDSTPEVRKEPEGKETSPADTAESARSPEPGEGGGEVKVSNTLSSEITGVHLISAVEAPTVATPEPPTMETVQESETLAA